MMRAKWEISNNLQGTSHNEVYVDYIALEKIVLFSDLLGSPGIDHLNFKEEKKENEKTLPQQLPTSLWCSDSRSECSE